MANKTEIISKINAHVASRGGTHVDWYVGIATDPETRLFSDHNVDREYGKWIYVLANDENTAREAEAELLEYHGYDGGTGGGDHPRYVYAFLKTKNTRR